MTSRRRYFPLSILALLAGVVLIPFLVAASLATTVVVNQKSVRDQAVAARELSLTLDSLLRDRAAAYNEYVPTLAIVEAGLHHLSEAQLDNLLGVDFQAELVSARQHLDRLPDFEKGGLFSSERVSLLSLRTSIDLKTAAVPVIHRFFNGLASLIDARWQSTFKNLSHSSESSSAYGLARGRVDALGASSSAFTSGLSEENLPQNGSLETLLTAGGTPGEVQSLIVSYQQFKAAVEGFPAGLGPGAAKAWKQLIHDKLNSNFSRFVQLAISVGLGNKAPPYATDPAAIGGIARSEIEWDTSLTNLVLASSADLRAVTTSQADSASRALDLVLLFMLLLLLAAVSGVVIVGRAIRRPLARLVSVAESVKAGELDVPELDESGPKELSLAAGAVNEMSATLRAVQSQAIALAAGQFNDPALRRPLPGRTGGALQSALSELQDSVRELDAQRQALNERATRDYLTGLLNREAALESLGRDLARVMRSDGQLDMAILFIDLDELKKINDSFGHYGGDKALRGVAEALRASTRASDVVARFGGDEFVVGWLGNAGSDAPSLLAGRIVEYVSKLDVLGGGERGQLGCTIGVARTEGFGDTLEEIIARADRALYIAKDEGRGRWHELSTLRSDLTLDVLADPADAVRA